MCGDGRQILIVEDDIVVARDIEALLLKANYSITAVVGRLEDAERVLDTSVTDAAVVDIGLERGSGLDLGASMARRQVPFLYLTARSDTPTMRRAAATEPMGYVVKPFTESQLLAALLVGLENRARKHAQRLAGALQRITGEVVELGLASMAASGIDVRPIPELSELSTREWEVLRELLAHNRVPAIAQKLFISPATVRNHLKSIFAKLGVHSQQELLERVLR